MIRDGAGAVASEHGWSVAATSGPGCIAAGGPPARGRNDSIAFTLEWEKGCADPPALLKEAAKPEKLNQI
jgi:hypothetical protein